MDEIKSMYLQFPVVPRVFMTATLLVTLVSSVIYPDILYYLYIEWEKIKFFQVNNSHNQIIEYAQLLFLLFHLTFNNHQASKQEQNRTKPFQLLSKYLLNLSSYFLSLQYKMK